MRSERLSVPCRDVSRRLIFFAMAAKASDSGRFRSAAGTMIDITSSSVIVSQGMHLSIVASRLSESRYAAARCSAAACAQGWLVKGP